MPAPRLGSPFVFSLITRINPHLYLPAPFADPPRPPARHQDQRRGRIDKSFLIALRFEIIFRPPGNG